MLTFVVGEAKTHGDPLIVYETKKEFQEDSNPPPSAYWAHITVAGEEARRAWIAAKEAWLRAAWTSNQTREEREENARLRSKLEQEMRELEIDA